MRRYVERIRGTEVSFAMAPIPGGRFVMGSPDDEPGRHPDEGPQRSVAVEPFWIGTHEVTWDLYRLFQLSLDLASDDESPGSAPALASVDAVTRPTPPYVPMDFGMGVEGYPAISMTQFAARHFTKWLSKRTGRYYRLPSEAEWEYACRAGSTTAWSFGSDPARLSRYAWWYEVSEDRYQPVGRLEPSSWGLFDMHGNVAEWTLDRYGPYAELAPDQPVAWPSQLYPRVVRGGSWQDDPEALRCAARRGSKETWKRRDPQLPKSIWYLTDGQFVGLRVVRPLREPDPDELARFWEPDTEEVAEILERQRSGQR